MTTPTGDVDWAEAERRQRRRDLLAAPSSLVFLTGIVLLTGRFGFWTGTAAWLAAGAFPVVAAVAAAAAPRNRARVAAAHRIEAALRHHADPGPELRVRADAQARYLTGVAWAGWPVVLGSVGLLIGGRWDERPAVAAVGAVLVVGVAAAFVRWWRARLSDARRWLADPPGPPRDPPPPTTAERWLTGRRAAALLAGPVLLPALVGLALALAVRS